MVKEVIFQTKHDECSIEVLKPTSQGDFTKLASTGVSSEIQEFIDANIKPDPRYVYVLLSALGAGEIWGPNVNGDYFREEDIVKSHKTFTEFGFAFTHHQNKDPLKAKGRILYSHWNPRMRRVELIVQLDRTKAPNIARDIDNGKMWDVSMGCKVKFDVCSICGNKAFTRDEYCDHLRTQMGKILPDGRQVYAINPNPRFFDISFVWIGADRASKTLMKIASANGDIEKVSKIEKEVPVEGVSEIDADTALKMMHRFNKLKEVEQDLPEDVLEELCAYPANDILTTLGVLGIVLKPHEFAKIYTERAEDFPNATEAFRSIIHGEGDELVDQPWSGDVQDGIVAVILPHLPERSALKPYIYPRIIKMAQEDRKARSRRRSHFMTMPLTVGATAFYRKYLDQIPYASAKGLDAILKKHPWLLPLITGATVGTLWGMGARDATNHEPLEKVAANLGGRMFVAIPAAYLTSHIAKRLNGDSRILEFLRKHPFLVSLLGVAATNSASDWAAIRKAFEAFGGGAPANPKVQLVKFASEAFGTDHDLDELMRHGKEIAEDASEKVYSVNDPADEWGYGASALVGMAADALS